jgi:GNAT superfamily N-acetyltransferase
VTSGLTIRAAVADDVAAIQAVADATWRASYVDILPEAAISQFLVDAYSPGAIGRRVERADRFEVAVSEADGSVVGFSEWLVEAGADEALWAAIYVRPDWQRRGIGRAFLLSAFKEYRDRLSRLVVVVAQANTAGVWFFGAMGFVAVERLDSGIHGASVSELRMAMLLR